MLIDRFRCIDKFLIRVKRSDVMIICRTQLEAVVEVPNQ